MRRSTNTPAGEARAGFPCACATVRRAARAVTQLYDGHLRSSEIEGTQFALLSVLSSQGPCSQAAIGHRFALDKTTLSRNLKLLKDKGWIETAAAADGRERRYVLTAAGEKRLAAAKPAWRRAQEHLRTSMTAKEWDAMWKLLHAMTAAAQTAQRGLAEGNAK
ncbi:MAG: winged helix-turn-helix transcriptional regulator [Acidobacteria bacterium]|nr:winged helix-turn-helix transcriptional regulator [Acidobacteriota bacterium]